MRDLRVYVRKRPGGVRRPFPGQRRGLVLLVQSIFAKISPVWLTRPFLGERRALMLLVQSIKHISLVRLPRPFLGERRATKTMYGNHRRLLRSIQGLQLPLVITTTCGR